MLDSAVAVASNNLQGLFNRFRESSEVPSAILKDMEIVRPRRQTRFCAL